jgi:choline dehydrogenase
VPDEQAFASVASCLAGEGLVDLHVFSEISMDGRLGIFVACLTPRSRGRLRLRSADPSVSPIVDHAYLSDPDGRDLAVLTDGVGIARSFAATAALRPLLRRETEPGPAADVPDAIRRGVIHYWHPVGTCAMGSVTDARGRLVGVEGLVVADASLMPRTVRATTNLPTVVLAERIAGWLAA